MGRSKETVRDFAWEGDVSAVVGACAKERDFEPCPSDDGVLRYWGSPQGTKEIPMSALCISIAASDGSVTIRFWIASGNPLRLAVLFSVPASMGIESGGFIGFANRRRARVAANDLLARFGQPPIS